MKSSISIFSQSVFPVRTGEIGDTDQAVVKLREIKIPFDECINSMNFPFKSDGILREEDLVLVNPKRFFNEEDGLKALSESGLLPPTLEHTLCFVKQYATTMVSDEKPLIIFLHKPWKGPYRRFVLFLNRSVTNGPFLGLLELGDRFGSDYILIGVRPDKKTKKEVLFIG